MTHLANLQFDALAISQLATMANDLSELAAPARRMVERSPWTRQSGTTGFIVNPTQPGSVLDGYVEWIARQEAALFAELKRRTALTESDAQLRGEALVKLALKMCDMSEVAAIAADAANVEAKFAGSRRAKAA